MTTPKVFIGCEYSGAMRRAFRDRGWYALSCDLLPADDNQRLSASQGRGGQSGHWQGDVFDVLSQLCDGEGAVFDLMIFHPPCTYLTNAGVRWLYKGGRGSVRDPMRWRKMDEAARFFYKCLRIPRHYFRGGMRRIAVENPVPHSHAQLPPFTQSIQPWQFGEPETKRTCWWLEGLPLLTPTKIMPPDQREPRVHHESPGPDRWKRRSTTLPGIAEACAAQWGSYAEKQM